MVFPLEMGWRHRLIENRPVDPSLLDAQLPGALTPDTHDGSAWLSVVPFTNVAVRPKALPTWTGLPELDIRIYVTHDGVPGVYVFSLDAQGLSTVVARPFHHLPYDDARISLDRVQCRSRRKHPWARPTHDDATYWPAGELFSAPEGPLGEFLVEHYRFYTETPDGTLRYADMSHGTWTLYPATDVRTDTLCSADGFDRPGSEPAFSPGFNVAAEPGGRAPKEAGT